MIGTIITYFITFLIGLVLGVICTALCIAQKYDNARSNIDENNNNIG